MNLHLETEQNKLAGMDAADRIRWAVKTFPGGVAATSSFGAESAVLLHLIRQAAPDVPVLFINTGYLFPETLAFKNRLAGLLGLGVREAAPLPGSPVFSGEALYKTDPDRCCAIHKVDPLRRALEGWKVWITGVRADQTETRARMGLLEERSVGVYKLNPILDWNQEQVNRCLGDHNLPLHPLTALGYTSLGCQPCTAPPRPGEDGRSGRWAGLEKKECGIHLM